MKLPIIIIGISAVLMGFAALVLGSYALNYFQIPMSPTGIELAGGFFMIIGFVILYISMHDSGDSGGR